jgi:YVTN family beta-propeller protein
MEKDGKRRGPPHSKLKSSQRYTREAMTMPQAFRFLVLGACVLALAWILPGQAGNPPPQKKPADLRLRRPIALALADGDKTLLVANRESGTVALLDTAKLQVTAEVRCGEKLSDMAATRERALVVVTDEAAGEAVLLERRQGSLRELRRVKVGLSPVGVCVSDDGALAAVACLWPRRLAVLDLTAARKQGPALAPVLLDLPFAPRRLLPVPGGPRVIVADAFGGQLAVVNLRSRKVESVRRLLAHNIRGLALDRDGKSLLLTHQVLHAQGRTVPGDIVSGNVITNNAHKLSLAAVLDSLADFTRDDRLYALGDIERGAGDPAALAETPDGQLLVALAGVNEVALGRPEQATWTRLAVGQRPTALAVDAAGRRAYVANTFGDSVSVIDLRAPKVVAEVRLGPAAPELGPEERGEVLFYDARLSHDAWYSCHSCHPDGHSNGRLNDNFTDGSFGTPKRVLGLLGTRDTGPWAWDGRMKDLESQVRNSLRSTMQGPAPSAERVNDLAAFLRTVPPPPSLLKARGAVDAEALKRGRRVFARQKCATCHAPPAYTTPRTYDVGVHDELGQTHFNPPSLRGVSQAGPYFHDNRARTLEEVFTRHRHQLSGKLSEQEVRDLLHFLGSL